MISPVKYTPKLRAQPAEYAEITTPDKQTSSKPGRVKRDQMFSSVTQRYHHHEKTESTESGSEEDVFAMQRRLRQMASAPNVRRGASLRDRKPTNDIFESSTDKIFERLDLKKSEPRLSPFDWLDEDHDERPGTSSAASILARSRNPSARSRIPSNKSGSGEPEILTLPIIPIWTDDEVRDC